MKVSALYGVTICSYCSTCSGLAFGGQGHSIVEEDMSTYVSLFGRADLNQELIVVHRFQVTLPLEGVVGRIAAEATDVFKWTVVASAFNLFWTGNVETHAYPFTCLWADDKAVFKFHPKQCAILLAMLTCLVTSGSQGSGKSTFVTMWRRDNQLGRAQLMVYSTEVSLCDVEICSLWPLYSYLSCAYCIQWLMFFSCCTTQLFVSQILTSVAYNNN